jgi:hypothetical protein
VLTMPGTNCGMLTTAAAPEHAARLSLAEGPLERERQGAVGDRDRPVVHCWGRDAPTENRLL